MRGNAYGFRGNSLTGSSGSGAIRSCCFSRSQGNPSLRPTQWCAQWQPRRRQRWQEIHVYPFVLLFDFQVPTRTLALSGMSVNTRRLEIRMGSERPLHT